MSQQKKLVLEWVVEGEMVEGDMLVVSHQEKLDLSSSLCTFTAIHIVNTLLHVNYITCIS